MPDGLPSWFRDHVRDLVARKRELLPTVTTFITNAKLESVDEEMDRLIVTTAPGTEDFMIWWRPDPTGTPSFGQRLRRLGNDTEELADWVLEMKRRRLLNRQDVAEVAMVCGARRVALAGYRECAAIWTQKQTAPSAKRAASDWVSMAEEIDDKVTALLATLT